jgi:sarcosine oxidase subunit alpha
MRLGPQPGEEIDRERPFTFRWNGDSVPALDGDTIASALAASGLRVFSRSYKYHRPRGLLTASFHDPGCFFQVGDEPNVRGAHRLAEPGLDVRSQNTWPSLAFDVKAVNQLAGRFLGPGFYYKTFIKPQRLWPLYERVLQRFTHAGHISADTPRTTVDKRYAHPDVLVAGGGPAGLAAAVAAAQAGARVMLVEEEHRLGGHLRWGDSADLAALAELRALVAAAPGIEVHTNAVVAGRYDGNWTAVVQRGLRGGAEQLIKARAKVLVVAPGLIERPYVFAGNDMPGVMLSTAVRRLIGLHAVKPGQRAVVLTANADGDAAIAHLRRAGVEVARVLDARAGQGIVRVRGGGTGQHGVGRHGVGRHGVGRHGVGRHWGVRAVVAADGTTTECDLLVMATGWTAPAALLSMAGDQPAYDPRAARFFPRALPDNVLATGGIAGDGSHQELIAHAEATGREAARRAARIRREWQAAVPTRTQANDNGHARLADDGDDGEPVAIPELPVDAHPELFRARTHGIVDFCEDVSSKDIISAVREGYDSIELAKRYTTATMGPTQGKIELVNTIAVAAEATGRSIAETGTTTWRPPYAPVTLGALAGRPLEPVRYSPMQPWHEAHHARPLVAGAWIRPDHYGDPAAEVRNVRSKVGIIDVTPIGKLDLRGPDVPRLLNLVYVNKWSKLGIGRVRYGVMCAEDGVVFDDGVTGRLGPEHYLMSTTSSGAAAVWEWLENVLQTMHPDWAVHVTPVTTAYASMNVAGPQSRELLLRVTEDVDLANEAFGYMEVRAGRVAGVDGCVLWRIGFTGELSYELHVPAAYGLYVWETLMDRGRDLGIAPFGVEAQRILRLEKGHLIVGQDTDGLTRGFSAGLDWAIKLDKDDFLGKPELAWQHEAGGGRGGGAGGREGGASRGPRLVGLQPEDGTVVPPEASQIIDGPRIAGRVTSSRMSPTLGRSICLAQVEAALAAPGTRVTIRLPGGRLVTARVTEHLAHVDPEGSRMRV